MEHIKSLRKSSPKVRNISLPHLKKNNKDVKPRKKKVAIHQKNKNNNGWKKD